MGFQLWGVPTVELELKETTYKNNNLDSDPQNNVEKETSPRSFGPAWCHILVITGESNGTWEGQMFGCKSLRERGQKENRWA